MLASASAPIENPITFADSDYKTSFYSNADSACTSCQTNNYTSRGAPGTVLTLNLKFVVELYTRYRKTSCFMYFKYTKIHEILDDTQKFIHAILKLLIFFTD